MSSPVHRFGSVSVVIPAYRAEECIARTLDLVQGFLESTGVDHEVIVVSDASPDRTADIVTARGRGVRLLANATNHGKGYSVKRGMLASTKAWAVFTDADNSTSIEHLERFAAHADSADMVIASRLLPDSNIVTPRPFSRRVMGRVFPTIVNALAPTGVADTQCGFKLFRRSAVEALFPLQRIEGFAFDVELLLLARRLGLRVAEVPIDWDNPESTTIRASVESLRMLRDVVKAAARVQTGAALRAPGGVSGPGR
ncbi:MAG: glycosyltransferase [Phycisphaerales bacterium]|nr:glycosyltransferase [Phycisphaerales bacterium]